MNDENESVGQRILTSRLAKHINQSQLAQIAGVSAAAIWQWETRGKVPRPGTLRKVADALKVSPDFLLTGKTDANRPGKTPRDLAPPKGKVRVNREEHFVIAQQIENLKTAIRDASGIDVSRISIEIKISG